MTTVSAVLLAAGESCRMGDLNKLSVLINGIPLLRYSAQTLLASKLQDIVVVIGHEEALSREVLEGLPVTIVTNENYKQGQMTSVHAGLSQLTKPCDGIMISLCDQPLLSSSDINTLIDAFDQREYGSILVPSYKEKRGNPIVLAYEHRAEILQGELNLGCKRLIERHPDWVSRYEMATDDVLMDLDTPEDYLVLQQRLKMRGDRMTIPLN